MPKANMANRRQNPTLISYAGLLLSLSILFVISNNSYALKGEPQPKLDSVVLDIGGHALDTELALTAVERQRGLSYRESLGEDSGMLFVYRQPQPLVFTMRETSIPLAIAFLDHDFVILEIQQMEPFAKHHYPSQHPAQYALEVNAGWFRRHDIKAGMRVNLPEQQ